eukprot:4387059-Amphidinium_carterae.1
MRWATPTAPGIGRLCNLLEIQTFSLWMVAVGAISDPERQWYEQNVAEDGTVKLKGVGRGKSWVLIFMRHAKMVRVSIAQKVIIGHVSLMKECSFAH